LWVHLQQDNDSFLIKVQPGILQSLATLGPYPLQTVLVADCPPASSMAPPLGPGDPQETEKPRSHGWSLPETLSSWGGRRLESLSHYLVVGRAGRGGACVLSSYPSLLANSRQVPPFSEPAAQGGMNGLARCPSGTFIHSVHSHLNHILQSARQSSSTGSEQTLPPALILLGDLCNCGGDRDRGQPE
jgi:hypothetical protein